MEEHKQASADYFESKSPPKKKARTNTFQFEDGSDEETEKHPVSTMNSDDEILSDENDSDNEIQIQPRRIPNPSTVSEKHPDLEDKRVRTLINTIFDPKIYSLTLKQLGIRSESSKGKKKTRQKIFKTN